MYNGGEGCGRANQAIKNWSGRPLALQLQLAIHAELGLGDQDFLQLYIEDGDDHTRLTNNRYLRRYMGVSYKNWGYKTESVLEGMRWCGEDAESDAET